MKDENSMKNELLLYFQNKSFQQDMANCYAETIVETLGENSEINGKKLKAVEKVANI